MRSGWLYSLRQNCFLFWWRIDHIFTKRFIILISSVTKNRQLNRTSLRNFWNTITWSEPRKKIKFKLFPFPVMKNIVSIIFSWNCKWQNSNCFNGHSFTKIFKLDLMLDKRSLPFLPPLRSFWFHFFLWNCKMQNWKTTFSRNFLNWPG